MCLMLMRKQSNHTPTPRPKSASNVGGMSLRQKAKWIIMLICNQLQLELSRFHEVFDIYMVSYHIFGKWKLEFPHHDNYFLGK